MLMMIYNRLLDIILYNNQFVMHALNVGYIETIRCCYFIKSEFHGSHVRSYLRPASSIISPDISPGGGGGFGFGGINVHGWLCFGTRTAIYVLVRMFVDGRFVHQGEM